MSQLGPNDSAVVRSGRHQRRARNYLLDPRFQLKYTAVLVGVAVLVAAVLGYQLYRTSLVLTDQSRLAVEQGQETVRRGKGLIDESRKVSAVVSMNIVKDPAYADNPELAAIFKENNAEQEKHLNAEQQRLEQAAASLSRHAELLAQQQRSMLYVLFGGLSIFVVAIGLAGIVFTHKVAGPIFKMKGLLRRVGEGKYAIHSGLRKGDELQHFFDSFVRMVEALRTRQETTIKQLDLAISQLEDKVDPPLLTPLRDLRRDMKASLEEPTT